MCQRVRIGFYSGGLEEDGGGDSSERERVSAIVPVELQQNKIRNIAED